MAPPCHPAYPPRTSLGPVSITEQKKPTLCGVVSATSDEPAEWPYAYMLEQPEQSQFCTVPGHYGWTTRGASAQAKLRELR